VLVVCKIAEAGYTLVA